MSGFKSTEIELNPGDLAGADVDFFEYEFNPVIYVNDSSRGEMGAIALFGKIRTFPLDAVYSYNASPLSKEEFLQKYPALSVYFEELVKQAA